MHKQGRCVLLRLLWRPSREVFQVFLKQTIYKWQNELPQLFEERWISHHVGLLFVGVDLPFYTSNIASIGCTMPMGFGAPWICFTLGHFFCRFAGPLLPQRNYLSVHGGKTCAPWPLSLSVFCLFTFTLPQTPYSRKNLVLGAFKYMQSAFPFCPEDVVAFRFAKWGKRTVMPLFSISHGGKEIRLFSSFWPAGSGRHVFTKAIRTTQVAKMCSTHIVLNFAGI